MGHIKFFVFIIVITLFSCNSGEKKTNTLQNAKKNIANTKQLQSNKLPTIFKDSIYSAKSYTNANYSYTIFIPSTQEKPPVLILFDPHADGTLPVSSYKNLAKKYGIALIASNNSQNGLDGNEYYNILAAANNDIRTMFSQYIDTTSIFTGGFSGGGRVASMFANLYKIPVVISAGAGVANPQNINFNFIGFAGNKDFNFIELASLDEVFLQYSPDKEHYTEFFDGIHEWPDTTIYETAFEYISLYLMKSGKKPVDKAFCKNFIDKYISLASGTKNPLKKAKIYEKFTVFGKNVFDISKFQKELASIKNSNAYKKALRERNEIFNEELNLRQAYAGALLNKPLDWWKQKMAFFDKKQAKKNEESLMYSRIRNFLSLNTYMLINKYLKQGNTLYATQLLDLYKIIDPENPEIPNLEKQTKSIR